MPAEKPWERQKGETEKAYEAFSIYRDLGEGRTLTEVTKKLGKSRTLIDRWRVNWNWYERVREYDNSLAEAARAKAIKDRKAMIDRHIDIALQVQEKALTALKRLKTDDMTPKDIKEYIKMATDLERLTREPADDEKDGVIYQMEVEDMDDIEREIYGDG